MRKLDSVRLFKRFSQITGVPIKNLKPAQLTERPGLLNTAHFNPIKFGTTDLSKVSQKVARHEEGHALQRLANLKIMAPVLRKMQLREKKGKLKSLNVVIKPSDFGGTINSRWLEPTNFISKDNKFANALGDSFNDPVFFSNQLIGMPMALTQMSLGSVAAYLSIALPKYINAVRRQTYARRLVERHGEDGLLLLWVAPPKKLDALQIKKWEMEMVSKGYLNVNGGLTKQGIKYWREHLQPQAIWQELDRAEKEREKTKTLRK